MPVDSRLNQDMQKLFQSLSLAQSLLTSRHLARKSRVRVLQAMKWEREIESRNRPLSDEDLDGMMPATGYRILDPPPGYAPIMTPARKLMGTPTPMGTPGYVIPEEQRMQQFDVPTELEGLPELKPEDMQHFGKLLKDVSSFVPCIHH